VSRVGDVIRNGEIRLSERAHRWATTVGFAAGLLATWGVMRQVFPGDLPPMSDLAGMIVVAGLVTLGIVFSASCAWLSLFIYQVITYRR
jgi:hypothetical protein